MSEPLLVIEDLVRHHHVGADVVHAVDGVSLELTPGETLGLVGESGCGKSTLARCCLRLERPTGGRIYFAGRDITDLSERELRPLRRDMQMVFQDPYASLNPRKRVRQAIGEVLRLHGLDDSRARIEMLLARVGLGPEHTDRYPRELSGGQRQRVGIARALAVDPKLLVLDEPVSALDVSVQAQVVNLLAELQADLGLTYLFIAHDLGVVRHVSDRIGVMHLGHLVELAPVDDFYAGPLHPYGEALLSAVPEPDPAAASRPRIILDGGPPSAIAPPPGCRFADRCRYATDVCHETPPPLEGEDRLVACYHPRPAALALTA